MSFPYVGIYGVTKHAIVALTETLHRELVLGRTKVKASVLCPGFVETQLGSSARNRPAELQNVPADRVRESEDEIYDIGTYLQALYDRYEPEVSQQLEARFAPQQVAESVFEALVEDQFYILTHPGWKHCVRHRFEDILEERNPDAFL